MPDLELHAGSLSAMSENSCRIVQHGHFNIGVIQYKGKVYAYENRCLHQGGPVCQGEVLGKYEAVLGEDRSILFERFSEEQVHMVCPWHGWEYDVATGECVTDRSLRLKSYPTVVRNGEVYVLVRDDAAERTG